MPRELQSITKTIQEQVAVKTTCDFCGKESPYKNAFGSIIWNEWMDNESIKTRIQCCLGNTNEDLEIIICPDCFRKLSSQNNIVFNDNKFLIMQELLKIKREIKEFERKVSVFMVNTSEEAKRLSDLKKENNEIFSELLVISNRICHIREGIENLEKVIQSSENKE